MSKYNKLWEYIKNNESDSFELSFDEIADISEVELDHSFLKSKKELEEYGYTVGKISIKNKRVSFERKKQGE